MASGRSAAQADAFVMLEARHVDALTEAVRTSTMQISLQNEVARKQLEATRSLTAQVTRLADLLALAAPGPPSSDMTPGGRAKPPSAPSGSTKKKGA